jgi:hypothetical protein
MKRGTKKREKCGRIKDKKFWRKRQKINKGRKRERDR